MKVRKEIMPHAKKNNKIINSVYNDLMAQYHSEVQGDSAKKVADTMDNIIDIR